MINCELPLLLLFVGYCELMMIDDRVLHIIAPNMCLCQVPFSIFSYIFQKPPKSIFRRFKFTSQNNIIILYKMDYRTFWDITRVLQNFTIHYFMR